MTSSAPWKRVRTAGIALIVVAAVLAAIRWAQNGTPLTTAVGLTLTAAIVAFVVSLYLRSQSRSRGHH